MMFLDSSQEEVNSIIHSFLNTHPGDVDPSNPFDLIAYILLNLPSQTSNHKDQTQEEESLITPAPELRVRNALPEPQNGNDCSAQASRSATEAIRQASQQASESIRQISQSASQAVQQASQSATNAIRQVENSASQSVAQASRSSSSISSSASSMVSSIQSSAGQAVSRANSSARSVMAEASQVILQASAAIAAATGSAAAAGSSFLEQAAKATPGTDPSTLGNKATDNQQISTSQTVAVTATQAALAIVGSIIASTLITFLIYFLFQRHRKRVQHLRHESWNSRSFDKERKLSTSSSDQQTGTSFAKPQGPQFTVNRETRIDVVRSNSTASSEFSLSMFPKTPTGTTSPQVKQTFVPWNPSRPPKPPRLGQWLTTDTSVVSPFGSIKLPVDGGNKNAPLGGQLKSPHFTSNKPPLVQTSRYIARSSDLPLRAAPTTAAPPPIKREIVKPPVIRIQPTTSLYPTTTTTKPQQSSRSRERQREREKKRAIPTYLPSPLKRKYSEAKASVWTPGDSSSGNSTPVPLKGSPLRRERGEVDWAGEGGVSGGLGTPDTGVLAGAKILDAVRGVVVAPGRFSIGGRERRVGDER